MDEVGEWASEQDGSIDNPTISVLRLRGLLSLALVVRLTCSTVTTGSGDDEDEDGRVQGLRL